MTVTDPTSDPGDLNGGSGHETVSVLEHVSPMGVFLATGLAPLAWVVHLVGAVVLVNASCETGHDWPVHLVTAVTAAASLYGLRLALALRANARTVAEGGEVARRMRFLSTLGIYLGVLFLALILVESVPILVLEPCTP